MVTVGNLWKTNEQGPDCLYPKEGLCWVMPEKEKETCKSQPLVVKHQGLLLGHHSCQQCVLSFLHPCCGH